MVSKDNVEILQCQNYEVMNPLLKKNGQNFPHQFDQTKPLPKGLGSQATGPFVLGPLHFGTPKGEGLCRDFGAFLDGGDPQLGPHLASCPPGKHFQRQLAALQAGAVCSH
jgi:hypothetical protein